MIKQKYNNDCALCCLVMLIYNYNYYNKCKNNDIKNIYQNLKIKYINYDLNKNEISNFLIKEILKNEIGNVCENKDCSLTNSGIMTVESINKPFSWHCLFWNINDNELLDSSNKKIIMKINYKNIHSFIHIKNKKCPKN